MSIRGQLGPQGIALILAAMASAACACVVAAHASAQAGAASDDSLVETVITVIIAATVLFCAGMAVQLRRIARAAGGDPVHGARIDGLTGLANRRGLDMALASRAQAARRGGGITALLLLDIDGYRGLRNAHGAKRADALLQEIGRRLAGSAAPDGVAARLHGDEFAVVVALPDEQALAGAAAALLAEMQLPFHPNGASLRVSFSIGAAVLTRHGDTPEALVGAAQLALDQAKSAGGSAWQVFDPVVADRAQRRQALQAQLPAALADGQIIPYYQPIVFLASGEVQGFEVLARWQHPELGLLQPGEFIPLAEEQRLCGQLTMVLLRQVIRDSVHWPTRWRFAFNAVASQLQDLIDFVRKPEKLPAGMLDPRRVELEITENTLITDMPLARAVVEQMHRDGATVVLDDFGTGYANFLHLREIPFDRIKIDRSFVADMLHDRRTEACVRAIVALGSSLGVAVTAEGVECEEEAARLRAMGCTLAQGYLYAKPMPAEAVGRFADRRAAMAG